MTVVYRIHNLTKVYKGTRVKANDDLSFDIHQGEMFGLLGPNGAGKSTLVKQLAGLIRPTAGSIQLFGMDVVRRPALIAEYIALQPQQAAGLWDLYPWEAIFHTGRFRGLSTDEARRQADALMEELGLTGLSRTTIRFLSGGQIKLVTLAVAFVANRPVLIFDEPTNDLDPTVRRMIWDKLLRLNQLGTTIILVTHNVLEAERVIRRVGIIDGGRMLALGTPGELKARVDQRVRLELLFREKAEQYVALLQTLGEVRSPSQQHWTVLCHRDLARDVIDRVLADIGLAQLDDFRILTPSLEDVYLQIGRGTSFD